MRKHTTPIHVGAGLMIALLFPYHPGLSWMLVLSFGLFELWQELRHRGPGCLDFWEMLLGLYIGSAILWLRATIEI